MNQLLFSLDLGGAGPATVQAEGLTERGPAASQEMARRDLKRLIGLKALMDQAGAAAQVPPALLAGIASRETHVGLLLHNGWDSARLAYGIGQVDVRFHQPVTDGPASRRHLFQYAGILAALRTNIQRAHPRWSEALQLRGAVVAYNSGPGNVRTVSRMDVGTTHGDYSADVWERAKYYAVALWGEYPGMPS